LLHQLNEEIREVNGPRKRKHVQGAHLSGPTAKPPDRSKKAAFRIQGAVLDHQAKVLDDFDPRTSKDLGDFVIPDP
jgi:hypothetical protein